MTGVSVVGSAGWAFLIFAGIALPLVGIVFARGEQRREAGRSGSATHDATGAAPDVPRLHFYAQALFTHALVLVAAVLTARAEKIVLFADVTLRVRDAAAAVLTLATVVGIGELSWRARTPAERERLWVRRILPRTAAERRGWIVISAGAAIAEEVAYRGAFVAVATAATGSLPVAVLASAAAFAAVHAPQGISGIGYVFLIALLHQALVLFTGTLLLAIVVHFAYDVLAGLWLARRHGLVNCCAEDRY